MSFFDRPKNFIVKCTLMWRIDLLDLLVKHFFQLIKKVRALLTETANTLWYILQTVSCTTCFEVVASSSNVCTLYEIKLNSSMVGLSKCHTVENNCHINNGRSTVVAVLIMTNIRRSYYFYFTWCTHIWRWSNGSVTVMENETTMQSWNYMARTSPLSKAKHQEF